MTVPFGSLVVTAGVCGLLSFGLLSAALGTDYWYIIEMSGASNSSEDLSSHSGLWSIHEGGKMYAYSLDSFRIDFSRYSDTEIRLLSLHRVVVVLLPLSLVLLLLGGVCGLVSSLARSPMLLTCSASYFFICSLLTLCGVSIYIIYSYEALAETERLVGPESLASVRTSFGWSLGVAWLSYGLELLTGALLLGAGQVVRLERGRPTRA